MDDSVWLGISRGKGSTTTSKPGGVSHAKPVSPEAALGTSGSGISSFGVLVVVTPDSLRGRGGPRGGSVCTGPLGAGVGLLVIPEGPAPGEDLLGRFCCKRGAGGRAERRASSQASLTGFSMASRSI